jgi:hypothetical protein
MYYIGWNPQVTVSYRLAIGLAVSNDHGLSWERYSAGPFVTEAWKNLISTPRPTSFLTVVSGKCGTFPVHNGKPSMITQNLRTISSTQNLRMASIGTAMAPLRLTMMASAIGRPCVIRKAQQYELYFSYRNTNQYRVSAQHGYKIGLAVSQNALQWDKKYDETGIALSESGWDNKMMEYCHVFEHKGISYMIYNGNDFGKEGFGYAVK